VERTPAEQTLRHGGIAMSILLDRRADGSVALYIEGDLQFDSRDEAAYHEALALPALALATARVGSGLRALICGGGDGLIARELLKSSEVSRIDLVDMSAEVLALAKSQLAPINCGSLDDPRVHTVVANAWEFAADAAEEGRQYHLIVSDFTVPQDQESARLHSVDWYRRLHQILAPRGMVAINGVSPSGAGNGYWSIYNSLRVARLHPRPYHIALHSYREAGYGDDWGFFLASSRPILPSELDDHLSLASPRRALKDTQQLRKLFVFPAEIAAMRRSALPTRLDSDLLTRYIYSGQGASPVAAPSGRTWNGLSFRRDRSPVPTPDEGASLLPTEILSPLTDAVETVDERAVLERVLRLMPALNRYQTREMVATFLEEPGRFLQGIDLSGLVRHLLARASELPRRVVEELRLLSARLGSQLMDRETLLDMGMRVVTIITLVIILGNLLFPDTVYGKGGSVGSHGSSIGSVSSISRSSTHSSFTVDSQPSTIKAGGFRSSTIGHGTSVDEVGTSYPPRTYHWYPGSYYYYSGYGHSYYVGSDRPAQQSQPAQSNEGQSFYRLTSEADVLDNGQVAISLTEGAYLLLGDKTTTVVDQNSGEPLLYLKRDPALIYRICSEIVRQQNGLSLSAEAKKNWMRWVNWIDFAPWRGDDVKEIENIQQMSGRLATALTMLGDRPQTDPQPPAPPIANSPELFTGVWTQPAGDYLILQLPDALAYMDETGWYSDPARTQRIADPYPQGFKEMMAKYLAEQVKNADAEKARLTQERTDLLADKSLLEQDKIEYDAIAKTATDGNMSVEYGSSEIPLREALNRTNADLSSVTLQIATIEKQSNELPAAVSASSRLLARLQK
jgi:spermidine synthase